MKIRHLLAFTLFALMIHGQASAERIAVFQLHPVVTDSMRAVVATQLLRGEMARLNPSAVVEGGRLDREIGSGVTCWDADCAAELAPKVGADEAVIGSITKLEDKLIIEVSLIRVADKTAIFADRFTALSTDDLEAVCRKLARALIEKKPIASFVNETEISQAETAGKPYRKGFYGLGLRFGFHWMFQGMAGIDKLNMLEITYAYEPRNFIIEMSGGFGWGSRDLTNAEIEEVRPYGPANASVSLTDLHFDVFAQWIPGPDEADFAPHFGLGFGIHALVGGGDVAVDDVTSPTVSAVAGITIFRQYDFHLTFDTRYSIWLTKVGPEGRSGVKEISQGIGAYLTLTRRTSGHGMIF